MNRRYRFGSLAPRLSSPAWLGVGWLIVVVLGNPGYAAESPAALPTITLPQSGNGKPLSGAVLARVACAVCHLFPDPSLIDKKTWKNLVLPHMETRMGVSPPDYDRNPEGQLIKSRGIYPDKPMIAKSNWNAIVDYYLTEAPETPLPQGPRPEIQLGIPKFEFGVVPFRRKPALTTMLQISPATADIYVGDEGARELTRISAQGEVRDRIKIDNIPIALVESPRGLYVTAIGSFPPSEIHRAELLFYPREKEGWGPRQSILSGLPRASQTEFCDFNGDGKMDFAICLFGNLTGRFSWYENLGNDRYQEHVLFNKSGSIQCRAFDFNEDGLPDIGLLVAQETEAFYIFLNQGKGKFVSQTVFQRHPLFGHNAFELADFNGDRRQDLLVINGDNGEYDSPTKKYHGIRIYLNRGSTRFEETYFFPLNGATKAAARDFDEDGDLDIACVSFFPDYRDSPRESFVYLRNNGGLDFAPFTFRECITGRWVALDAGDVDGDKDVDLVLGSYIRGPTSVPAFLSEAWEAKGPPLVLLKNTLR